MSRLRKADFDITVRINKVIININPYHLLAFKGASQNNDMYACDETNAKIHHPHAPTVPEALDFWRNLPHRGPLTAIKWMVI